MPYKIQPKGQLKNHAVAMYKIGSKVQKNFKTLFWSNVWVTTQSAMEFYTKTVYIYIYMIIYCLHKS